MPLRRLRTATVAIVDAIEQWKTTLRDRYTYFASLPEHEIAFFHRGESYLARMAVDLPFLPLPLPRDPLALHWFGEQLPWLVEKVGLRSDVQPLGTLAAFDVPKRDGGGAATGRFSQAEVAAMHNAQALILEEAARVGGDVALDELVSRASGRYDSPGARWQWSALQIVVYGSECYAALLSEVTHSQRGAAAACLPPLPSEPRESPCAGKCAKLARAATLPSQLPVFFDVLELTKAALRVQRTWRDRYGRTLRRSVRKSIVTHKEQVVTASLSNRVGAAARIQSAWKGFRVRCVLKTTSSEALSASQSAATQELQRRKAEFQKRKRDDWAVRLIQRRWRVRHAKLIVQRQKAARSLENRDAGDLLAQSAGVDSLERVIKRHRTQKAVMWDLYRQVCLAYETKVLQEWDERDRSDTLHVLLHRTTGEVERAKATVEASLAELLPRAAHSPLARASTMAGLLGGQPLPTFERKSSRRAAVAPREGVDVMGLLREAEAAEKEAALREARLAVELETWASLQREAAAKGGRQDAKVAAAALQMARDAKSDLALQVRAAAPPGPPACTHLVGGARPPWPPLPWRGGGASTRLAPPTNVPWTCLCAGGGQASHRGEGGGDEGEVVDDRPFRAVPRQPYGRSGAAAAGRRNRDPPDDGDVADPSPPALLAAGAVGKRARRGGGGSRARLRRRRASARCGTGARES